MLRVISQGKFSQEFYCLENISMRRRVFSWRCGKISWYYFKKDHK